MAERGSRPTGGKASGGETLSLLRETTRLALSALDQAAGLCDFSRSANQMESPAPLLEDCLLRIRQLLPFASMGIMLVDEQDSGFDFALCHPPDDQAALEEFVASTVEDGGFAFALREKRAVLDGGGGAPRRGLLHVMTTATRTRGMFVAALPKGAKAVNEVTLSILTIVLNSTAQALESQALYARIRQMNADLADKVARLEASEAELLRINDGQERQVRAKTAELRFTLDRLEAEVRNRKRAEALLETMNQRLEHKVEVRTRALFRKVAEMEAANKQLKQLERLKSGFLSSVSHELRTPLTSIMGFVKLIAKDFSRLFMPDAQDARHAKAERLLRNLDIVDKEAERLTRLINDVLDLTRIESGKMPWRDTPLSLAELAADALMAVQGRLENRPEVVVTLDVSPEQPPVLADRDRILQVFINLLDNALKFTEEGSVNVESRPGADGDVMLCVTDTGPGISPEEAEKIFDKFHQHDRKDTLKDKPKGTGLGLAICKHIVEHYGGRIWVEPASGGGSAFCFTLPKVQAPGHAGEDPESPDPQDRFPAID
uniref:histidine kinase n=1 Tax=Fundidesulfovibrio putealis TaxID=270496 RepID=A0A7C4EJF5_9BACT